MRMSDPDGRPAFLRAPDQLANPVGDIVAAFGGVVDEDLVARRAQPRLDRGIIARTLN